ncbi:tRNA1(Val) (adenine(37)-N6)-methyltransferase [Petrotoga sp. DB-2]
MDTTTKIHQIDQIYRSLKLKTPNKHHLPTHASVLLLATHPAKDNSTIVELGSGIGHVSLVIGKMLPNSKIIGIEIQKELYKYSLQNKETNEINNVEFLNTEVKNVKNHFDTESIDYIISNPPHYFDGLKSQISDRKIARSAEDLKVLEDFIYASKYLLKNKGLGCFIIHPYVLSDVLIILEKNNLEPQHIYIAYGNKEKDAQLISLTFRKNGGRNLLIHPPIFFSEWGREHKE